MNAIKKALRRITGHEARVRTLRDQALQFEHRQFQKMNWSYEKAVARLNGALPSIGRSDPFNRDVDSIHWVLAAALADDTSFNVRSILEIGTHNGRFARLVAELFPHAKVTTVDLPESDPTFKALYPDLQARRWTKVRDARVANLAHPNIRYLGVNSFFLPKAVTGEYDFIWVDAGHTYPEVAWDCCNAYHLCRDGGMLMTDDVLPYADVGLTGMVTRSTWEMLETMDRLNVVDTILFIKRSNGEAVCNPRARKYVSISRIKKLPALAAFPNDS